MEQEIARGLLDFVRRSPSCYHAIENTRAALLAAGYTELREWQSWELSEGGCYFVTRGGSTLAAFRLPRMDFAGFQLTASHSDSPTFKLKENPELTGEVYTRLNTEPYGGMLMGTWLDRPLSVAGRVLVRREGKLVQRLVALDRDLAIIPSVAIHMNREAGSGPKYDAHVDLVPLLGGTDAKGRLAALVAEAADAREDELAGSDLFLYNRQPGVFLARRTSISPRRGSTIWHASTAACAAFWPRRTAKACPYSACSTTRRSEAAPSRARPRPSCRICCTGSARAPERRTSSTAWPRRGAFSSPPTTPTRCTRTTPNMPTAKTARA